jgi:dolichyl-phosphate beta-glucosyltransferase
MSSFAIIVPCYNEAARLQAAQFVEFANNYNEIQFIFVNDGSKDETEKLLQKIQQNTPRINVISLPRNTGKGEAIRQGIKAALQGSFKYIGYLDADLSTSLAEFYQLQKSADQKATDMVLASRIKKIDTLIERSFLRHIVGRVIATIIDKKFNLGVYDTQCGAKIFKPFLLEGVIQKPFLTKWFFDVEILWRIKTTHKDYKAVEVPLNVWRNVKNSKISILSFPTIAKELFILITKY